MATPPLTFDYDPPDFRGLRCLRCAPATAGSPEQGLLKAFVRLGVSGASSVTITEIKLWVEGSPMRTFDLSPLGKTIGPTNNWDWKDTKLYEFEVGANPVMFMSFLATGYDVLVDAFDLTPYLYPASSDGFRTWGELRDLRPDEFWRAAGGVHPQAYVQAYAHDAHVSARDPGSADGYTDLLAGTDGTQREHHRVWHKPVYAISGGTVIDIRNTAPDNALYGVPVVAPDGNGNFVKVQTGDLVVLYAHLAEGSLDPSLLDPSAPVSAGDFIGLVGNSGSATTPHLHIHVQSSLGEVPHPLRLSEGRAVAWTSVADPASSSPWSPLDDRGVPIGQAALWPSEIPVLDRKSVVIRHFTITAAGTPWVVATDGAVLTSSDTVAGRQGLFFDIDPNGLAKEVAVHGSKPHVIGNDGKIWEGLPDKWAPLPGSPLCDRIAVDRQTGAVWVVTVGGNICRFDPRSRTWQEQPTRYRAKDIAVRNGWPLVIGLDDRIWEKGFAGWTPIPGEGEAKRLAVDEGSGRLWVIGMNDGIWSSSGDGNWVEHPQDGRGKDLCTFDGVPYVIGLDDGLWRSVGASGWQRLNLVAPV